MGYFTVLKMLLREWVCLSWNTEIERKIQNDYVPNVTFREKGIEYHIYQDDLFINLYLGSESRAYVFKIDNQTYGIIASGSLLNLKNLHTVIRIKTELFRTGYYNKSGFINTIKFLLSPYRLERYRIADKISAEALGYAEVMDALYELRGMTDAVEESSIIDTRIQFLLDTLYLTSDIREFNDVEEDNK